MEPVLNETEMQRLAIRWTASVPAVSAFIAASVRRHHDAEDLLQRTAAAVVALHEQYDPSKPFVAWAIGVARIEVLRYRQDQRRERVAFDTETIAALAGAFEQAAPEATEIRTAVDGCIKKLRGRLREIFVLHYVRNLRPSEIAQRLTLNTQSIFSSLHRGRLVLRQCVERSLGRTGGMS